METKRCSLCRTELPTAEFHNNSDTKDGLARYCKKCASERCREAYRRMSSEEKASLLTKVSQYSKSHRCDRRQQNVEYRRRKKQEVFSHYCSGVPQCQRCGCDNLCTLSIDHIDGNGAQHRSDEGVKAGSNFYQWLKKQGYPDGFQVLCMNCQFIKRYENQEFARASKWLACKKHYDKTKREALLHYCNGDIKCSRCGFTDERALSLDHINGDGCVLREQTKCSKTAQYAKNNGYPDNLQVLCMNCQYIKRDENKEYRRPVLMEDQPSSSQ